MLYKGGIHLAEPSRVEREAAAVAKAVAPFVSDEDMEHIICIFDINKVSLVKSTILESAENKDAFIWHGNGVSVT